MAEAAPKQSREQIRQETEARARSYFDRWDELYELVSEPEYQVKQDVIDSAPVIVTKMRAEGLTKE